MTVIGEALLRVKPDTQGFEGEVKSKLGGAFRSIAGVASAAFAGVKIAGFLQDAVGEAENARKVLAQTEAVIKSTGGAAKVSATDVQSLSDALSRQVGVDDEAISGLQNLLLTFTNVRNEAGKGNDVFTQATKVGLDMAAALGTDASASAIQLGKALNDPVKGITALTRVGVTFTQQQKDQIEAMVAAGDTLGAQKIILAELNKEFGGSAAAQAGPLDKFRVAVSNLKEEVGARMLPVLNKVATFLANNLPGAIDAAGRGFAKIKAAVEPVFAAIGPIVSGFFALFRREGDGAAGTASKLAGVIEQLRTTFQSVFDAIALIVSAAIDIITGLWDRFGGQLVEHIRIHLETVAQVFRGVLQIIQGVLDVFIGIFTGDWSRAWNGVKTIFEGIWNAIVGVLRQALNIISTVIGAAMAVITGIWTVAWNALKGIVVTAFGGVASGVSAGIATAVGFVRELPGKIKSALGNLANLLYEAGKAIITGLLRGIKDAAEGMLDFVGGLGGKIRRRKGPLDYDLKLLIPEGEALMHGLHEGIRNQLGPLLDTVSRIGPAVAGAIGTPSVTVTGTPAGAVGATGSLATLPPLEVKLIIDGKELTATIVDPMSNELRRRDAALA